MTDNLPALVGTTSETLAKHLQKLDQSRKALVQPKVDEQI